MDTALLACKYPEREQLESIIPEPTTCDRSDDLVAAVYPAPNTRTIERSNTHTIPEIQTMCTPPLACEYWDREPVEARIAG